MTSVSTFSPPQPPPQSSSSSAIAEMEQWLTTVGNHNSSHHSAASTANTAHTALQILRDSGDEQCLFLRTIIALQQPQSSLSSHHIELLFHCILGCRHVILGKWDQSYSMNFIQRVRDYFMISGLSPLYHQNRTIRMACFTTAASFWKRMWISTTTGTTTTSTPTNQPLELILLNDMSEICSVAVLCTPESLFAYLNVLMQQPGQPPQSVVEFLNCIVNEFSSKSMAVNYRMPLEFHKASHKSFESSALHQSLQLCITYIRQLTTTTTSASDSDLAFAVIQLFNDILGWEFGTSAWTSITEIPSSPLFGGSLIRPPSHWKSCIGNVNLVHAIFRIHENHNATMTHPNNSSNELLLQNIRQVILQLASITGPTFGPDVIERIQFASALCEGCLLFIQKIVSGTLKKEESSILLDLYQIGSRLVSNFRLSILLQIPNFKQLLTSMIEIGCLLLIDHVRECESVGGDADSMEYYDWREETMGQLLDFAVIISSDPQKLCHGGIVDAQNNATTIPTEVLSPLFDAFVICRTRMAALEETYHATNQSDLDEVREGISELALLEEIDSVAAVGRLNLTKSISCLSTLCGTVIPRLHSIWDGDGDVTPEISALLEEANLLILFLCHLLTDNNAGESPCIPDAIIVSCSRSDDTTTATSVVSAVHVLLKLADMQTQKLALNPSNQRLSPLLAKTLLSFLNRWAPAYIYPVDYKSSNSNNHIVQEWSNDEKAKSMIEFCISLCMSYLCFWPQEPPVRERARKLLRSFAMRSGCVRNLMIAAPAFQSMVSCHCIVGGIRLTVSRIEFESMVHAHATNGAIPSTSMLWGYHRLPYETKAYNLTTILIACSDNNDIVATNMINDSLAVLSKTFTPLVDALTSNQVNADNPNIREMACLCVDLFCGLAQASEMSSSERIPQLVSSYLPQLSNLMKYYANDMTVSESLLRFFRDYTAHFISILDRDQSFILFQASAELLRSYSACHLSLRTVPKKSQTEISAEEEQAYSDIICSIQLLINLGTKDFIDVCSSNDGVDSTQVTDIIFFGLQQILPLMTQGLLQFPNLCSLFFELVGFMVDTYPEKLCALPFELFDSLLESLMFGMSHYDSSVAKQSIQGLSSIFREHLGSGALRAHLDHALLGRRVDIIDQCAKRLLLEVVYQPIVMDRMESTAMAVLYIASIDVNRFANVVQDVSLQISNQEQRTRLDIAYTKLIQPDVLAKASANGYEGRTNRLAFRRAFELFVNEIHSFLVLR